MNADEILRKLRVYRDSNVYQLGCTASNNLNVNAQQTRAFNLVHALVEAEVLGVDSNVAVIGAGIAGITATAAIAAAGANVTLYDRKTSVMHLQAGNQTRFLHPSIARWPVRSFGYPVTHFPFLNWRAETAGGVAAQLLKQWRVHLRVFGEHIETKFGCTVREVIFDPNNPEAITLRKARGSDVCNILIVAAGYGIERRPMSKTVSYWRNDDLAQPILTATPKRTYLVSGTGDGGLTEVLRLTLKEFHHQRFIQSVMYDDWLFRQAGNMRRRLSKNPGEENTVWQRYLSSKSQMNEPAFLQLKRNDTKVYLNATGQFPSGTNAQMLHRLCVALLIRRGIVKYISGRLTGVFTNHENKQIAVIRGESGTAYLQVDEVIERHGTDPTLDKLFPHDRNLYRRLRDSWRDTIDETWHPYYSREFLADAFQRSYLERGYKVGFLLDADEPSAPIVQNIFSHLDLDVLPAEVQAWLNNPTVEGVLSTWSDRNFTVSLEECDLLEFGGRDFPAVPMPWRQFRSQHQRNAADPRDRCIFISTGSRELIEHLLRNDDMPYHVLRLLPADTFEPYLAENFPIPAGPDPRQPRPDLLISLNTDVFLYARTQDHTMPMNIESDEDYFEVHCKHGMLQAHSLLRLPVLLELLMNAWPTTKGHGMGWAVRRRQIDNQNDHAGNRLLEWNP